MFIDKNDWNVNLVQNLYIFIKVLRNNSFKYWFMIWYTYQSRKTSAWIEKDQTNWDLNTRWFKTWILKIEFGIRMYAVIKISFPSDLRP